MSTVVHDEQIRSIWPVVPAHEIGNCGIELMLRFRFAVKNDCVCSEAIFAKYCRELCCLSFVRPVGHTFGCSSSRTYFFATVQAAVEPVSPMDK